MLAQRAGVSWGQPPGTLRKRPGRLSPRKRRVAGWRRRLNALGQICVKSASSALGLVACVPSEEPGTLRLPTRQGLASAGREPPRGPASPVADRSCRDAEDRTPIPRMERRPSRVKERCVATTSPGFFVTAARDVPEASRAAVPKKSDGCRGMWAPECPRADLRQIGGIGVRSLTTP